MTDSFSGITINAIDNVAFDVDPTPGKIVFVGSVGAFNINLHSVNGNPVVGDPLNAILSGNYAATSSGDQTSTLTVRYEDLAIPYTGAENGVASYSINNSVAEVPSQDSPFDSATHEAFVNGASLGGQTGVPFSEFGTVQSVAGLGDDIDLALVLSLTHLANGRDNITTEGDFKLGVKSAVAPVPASLGLMAASMAGFGLLVGAKRRRGRFS